MRSPREPPRGALADGVRTAGGRPVPHPVADGGEGSRDALVAATPGARTVRVAAHDALGRPAMTSYGLLPDGTAVIEAADVIGLDAIRPEDRDLFAASSAGLAAPLRAAVAAGCGQVIVQLGGTATMDAGLGLLVALGGELRDERGQRLLGAGRDLGSVAMLDLAPARALLAGVDVLVATDVRSPLCGEHGAAHQFAAQKGASPEDIATLDGGLRRLAGLFGSPASLPGAGAGGGLGAALCALGGRLVPGVELILRRTGFDDTLRGAALCLTAEGKVDAGSSNGKAVGGVLGHCVAAGVPCVILGGAVEDAAALYADGAAAVLAIGRGPQSLDAALRSATDDLRATAHAITRAVSRLRHPAIMPR